ncbi:hypothetical protein HO133_002195 [Letharia lupina]|uniref:Uncharacterized protein n=1 Tax=Letharia lupina TaxID=560253 RepID=A0A8H6CD04_9LECA|nr:uncharacterized protein HO133_002195 [Letharia lupina]KAF6221340.1 hypothetical protein HO133_002195 [Letharia lupina]
MSEFADPCAKAGGVHEVTLAVLGAPAVGKSTFVRSSLDLKKASTSPVSSKKVSLEGKISVVRLLELGFGDVEITANQNVLWPTKVGDHNTPIIDGVLALYNVMDQGSIFHIPALLKALSKDGIPTVLVSAKSDSPRGSWEVDHDMVQELCSPGTGIESFPVSLSAPETHKRCISIILRNIMLKRRVALLSPSPRTTTTIDSQAGSSRRATSTGRDSEVFPRSDRSRDSRKSSDSGDELVSPIRGMEDLDPGDLPPNHFDVPIKGQASDTSNIISDPLQGSRGVQGSSVAAKDLLSAQNSKYAETEDDDAKELGVTFEDLVDRLLAQPMSKSDSKFAAIFLCLYRKFAPPSSLIKAIVHRFEGLNDRDLPHLNRKTSQLRYLNILRDWASDYPGDFAHPLTRRLVTIFVQGLAAFPEYAIPNKEISPHLDVVADDDDTQWACSDKSRSRANTTESFLTMSSVQSAASTLNADSPTLTADSSTEDVVEHIGPEKAQPARISGPPSFVPSNSRSESQSNGSFQTLLNTLENAQRQAQLLTPIPRNSLTKVQWHQFMEIPEEKIARELTRIDWVMYCSIRPRDLIRHVSLAIDQKEKCKSLEHFNRMIHQFNHVAFWVANVILLRDKPKHRARALEKFMSIAWKLRYLNNYNSLGAVISGINSIAVHRLAQTRELIPAPAQKQFMRLEILMGSQKSHSAYRLAWTNTPTQRIPFLPLHLRDLVLAEQGNRTYVVGAEGERINWKKFEIMGEVIIGIQKSQEVSYPTINKNEEVQRLVLDGRFCEDEDELYERSIQLEGQGLGESTKKKFNWFQR